MRCLKGASSSHLLKRALHTLSTFLFLFFNLLKDHNAPHHIKKTKTNAKKQKALDANYIFFACKGTSAIALCFFKRKKKTKIILDPK
jgi:hypothetical protein